MWSQVYLVLCTATPSLPPPWVHVFFESCANSSLRTQCAAVASADAHCATVFHRCLCRVRKKRRKQDQHLREMIVPPNQVKMSNAEIDSKILVVDGGGDVTSNMPLSWI